MIAWVSLSQMIENENENGVPVKVDGYVLDELDGELLIFDPESGRIVQVNETAALIWQLCDGRHSLQELGDVLAEAYPEAAEAVRQDIPVIVQQLVELRVLRWQAGKLP